MKIYRIVLLLSFLSVFSCAKAFADTLELPNTKEATKAFLDVIKLPESIAKQAEIKLGTCIPAIDAKYSGQVACTILLKFPGGSSESQSDFYRIKEQWFAQPSSSQDLLPFPDPKLRQE